MLMLSTQLETALIAVNSSGLWARVGVSALMVGRVTVIAATTPANAAYASRGGPSTSKMPPAIPMPAA